jgi:hypothetical protein
MRAGKKASGLAKTKPKLVKQAVWQAKKTRRV